MVGFLYSSSFQIYKLHLLTVFYCICLLGLPVQVRDHALGLKDEMPKSDVNKEYYTQNAEREVCQTILLLVMGMNKLLFKGSPISNKSYCYQWITICNIKYIILII